MLDKARTASYIPYTRGAQDVIETVFATQVVYPGWPAHVHAFKGVVDYQACADMTLARMRTPRERAAFDEADRRLLAVERELIGSLSRPPRDPA